MKTSIPTTQITPGSFPTTKTLPKTLAKATAEIRLCSAISLLCQGQGSGLQESFLKSDTRSCWSKDHLSREGPQCTPTRKGHLHSTFLHSKTTHVHTEQ